MSEFVANHVARYGFKGNAVVAHEVDTASRRHRLVLEVHNAPGWPPDLRCGPAVRLTATASVGMFECGAFGPVRWVEPVALLPESPRDLSVGHAGVLEDRHIMRAKRGDEVVATRHLDPGGADVAPGTIGTVFERAGVFGAHTGPLVRWRTGATCNVYEWDAEVVRATGYDGDDELSGEFSAVPVQDASVLPEPSHGDVPSFVCPLEQLAGVVVGLLEERVFLGDVRLFLGDVRETFDLGDQLLRGRPMAGWLYGDLLGLAQAVALGEDAPRDWRWEVYRGSWSEGPPPAPLRELVPLVRVVGRGCDVLGEFGGVVTFGPDDSPAPAPDAG